MAIVMVGLNGIGLGHLARTVCVADAITALGYAPAIFAQGTNSAGEQRYPGKRIPHLFDISRRERVTVAKELSEYALRSRPSIVFEDTHPSRLRLDPTVRRILVVRPTEFSHMLFLERRYGSTYVAFLIADAPDSPTWPFTTRETRRILGWRNWHVLGPVFRRPSEDEMRDVAQRYSIAPNDPVCVVSMGAGGIRSPGDHDAPDLFAVATRLYLKLRAAEPRTRMLFIRGPLAPADLRVPPEFETVSGEPNAHALAALARGAVIRGGFNTTWECIAGGTPFIAVPGTVYREPVADRVARLAGLGYAGDFSDHWVDPEWIARKDAAVALATLKWPGTPDRTVLERFLRL
jgi:hypothetical protein